MPIMLPSVRRALIVLLCGLGVALGAACKRDEKFPKIGTALASPIDVAASEDGKHFYILNADFDRTYNQGSILVIDAEGTKLTAVELPRMGRTLTLAGNDLLVLIDYPDNKGGPQALLYDVSNPVSPSLKFSQELDCSPFNAVMKKDYPYFAVSCFDGKLYLGQLAADRTQSTLKLVRDFGSRYPRRALHLDAERNLLLGFITDPGNKQASDVALLDAATHDMTTGAKTADVADEIPDSRQNSLQDLSGKDSLQTYQFFVYDIGREKEPTDCAALGEADGCTFPLRKLSDKVVQYELRYLYFKLFNVDGTPDPGSYHDDARYKYYRTNFWTARPDPIDANAFYLSHRGPPLDTGSPHANQVVRVRIVGDLAGNGSDKPKTEDVLSFERVYGFAGPESNKLHYPGDFVVREIEGQRVLLVNHFRDLVNWVRGDVYFSLAAKTLDDNLWQAETTDNQDPLSSWYQLAMGPSGRAASVLFYGNAVWLLDVKPGVGIEKYKRID